MPRVLAYAETRDGALRGVAREVVTAARRLCDALGADGAGGAESRVDALLMCAPDAGALAAELGRHGADRVWVARDEAFANYAPDAAVRAVAELAGQADYAAILFPASAQGKDLSPRVAARLDRSLAGDITELDVEDGAPVVTRPVYAGKARARIRFQRSPALVSLRPNVFQAAELAGEGIVEALEVSPEPARVRVKAIEHAEAETLDVTEAPIIVSGGRGMRDPENWRLLEDLVDALGPGATLGASRAVVDAGWRPHAEQVGQTGKVVSPSLYFAIGISGAIQHLAGMRTARTIVAVNRDPDAPIFKVATYGIVGDLFQIVPRLAEEIRQVRA